MADSDRSATWRSSYQTRTRAMRRVQLRGGARWQATRGVLASGECGAMSGPRRRKFVGPIVSRVTWHGGRGRQRSRWALIIALATRRQCGLDGRDDLLQVVGLSDDLDGFRVA